MIMELPKKFNRPFAEVSNNMLMIYQLNRFEDIMFELTYAFNEKRCVYCGKRLKKFNRTLDHRIPKSIGGVSIVDNLYPTCYSCNSDKAELLHQEYINLLSLNPTKGQRKKFLKDVKKEREKLKKKRGFFIYEEWIHYFKVEDIIFKEPEWIVHGNQYNKIAEFYQKYRHFLRPIIVDKDNYLLDGYNIVLFAIENKIKKVPVIRLDNVVLCDQRYLE